MPLKLAKLPSILLMKQVASAGWVWLCCLMSKSRSRVGNMQCFYNTQILVPIYLQRTTKSTLSASAPPKGTNKLLEQFRRTAKSILFTSPIICLTKKVIFTVCVPSRFCTQFVHKILYNYDLSKNLCIRTEILTIFCIQFYLANYI